MVPPVELPRLEVPPVMPERLAYTVPAGTDGVHVYPAGQPLVTLPAVEPEAVVEEAGVVADWLMAGVDVAVADVTPTDGSTDDTAVDPPEADPDTVLVTIDEEGTVPIAVVTPQVVA